MLIMMMGNPFEVKEFVLFFRLMSRKRIKAGIGQRLPAYREH